MPYEPTGQSFEKLLGGARKKVEQADFDIALEQANRTKDAQKAATTYENTAPLKKAEMNLAKAREEFDTLNKNRPAGKNVSEEKFQEWEAKRETARQNVKTAKQEIEKLSPTKKATVTRPKTPEEEKLESLKKHLPGQIEKYSNLSDQLHTVTLQHLSAQNTLNEHTTSMKEVRLPLDNTTKKLEELQNKGPIKQFPLFKLFVDKQKQRDKKIGELKQEKAVLEKKLRPLEAKNKELSSAVASFQKNKNSLEKELKNVDKWIQDARHEIKSLDQKINPRQPKKNNSMSL